jgi:ribosome-binding protein aMBF1 (putative translation factor)
MNRNIKKEGLSIFLMSICIKCHASEDNTILLEAISGKGIVKICAKCNITENLPVIRKADEFRLQEANKSKGTYERLAHYAKLDPVEHRKKFTEITMGRSFAGQQAQQAHQERSLREIVDKNVKKKIEEKKSAPKEDLVDNFHWLIMRARRAKKITQAQFASSIQEQEHSIKLLEEGIVPEGNPGIIKKVEDALNVRLKKSSDIAFSFSSPQMPEIINQDPAKKEIKEQFLKDFNPNLSKELKIADLKEAKKDGKEGSLKFVNSEEFPDPFDSKGKKGKSDIEDKELSNEEVERILYGE